MERRKFTIGLGALATGSAAAIGTGAFNIASAERSVTVDVADDADAYLGLEAIDEDYTDDGGDTLEIDVGDNGKGEGTNEDAVTIFKDLFRITNNGTENIQVTVGTGDNTSYDVNNPVLSYDREEQGGSSFFFGEGRFDEGDVAGLEPGDDVVVHLTVDNLGNEIGEEPDDPEDLDKITLYAEQSSSIEDDPTLPE